MTFHHAFNAMGVKAVETALAFGLLTGRRRREALEWLTVEQAIETRKTVKARKWPPFLQPLATVVGAIVAAGGAVWVKVHGG